jgi:minor extracellular serine protease Vpr
MKRVVAAAAVALLGLSPPSEARADRVSRLKRSVPHGKIAPAYTPSLSGPPVTVVVELADAPVAAAQAAAAARLTAPEKERIAQGLEPQQRAIAEHVRSRGGAVLGTFKHALNGVKVRVPARELASLAALPGVVAVRRVNQFKPDAARPNDFYGDIFVGAPEAWGGLPGIHGERVKVAVIDTGIDYTHANFGGPGTPGAYAAAHAAEALDADPAYFGSKAPKVKGGIDLAGDAYDADAKDTARRVPHPDSNPLDCFPPLESTRPAGGHGSHVAGTIAGFGVTAEGATYRGPYTGEALKNTALSIGPGVAPKADLYAVRVFGCEGSTELIVDAIDWAVKNDMDVINMSLGASFGASDDADAIAAQNAAKAGVIVVASAGNSGHSEYISGAPAAADQVISVAALDAHDSFPAARIALSPAGSITAMNANDAPLPSASLEVVVLRDAEGGVSLGCDEAEYADAAISGKLVVTMRGDCARVDRAMFGARHGAAAVAMINNAAGYPLYEGPIFGVGIPFLGIRGGSSADGALLAGSTGASLSEGGSIPNPEFEILADFTSGGPRFNDSALKPNLTAPGISVFSTLIGSGNQGVAFSGTSMAAPYTSGVAALTVQAHPRWSPKEIRAALLCTADASKVQDYEARLAGAGAVQAAPAATTQVVALAQPHGPMNLSFGFAELDKGFEDSDKVVLRNHGRTAVAFDVASAPTGGSPHTVRVRPSRVLVRPGEDAVVQVHLSAPAATAGNTDFFREVAGLVTFTPVKGGNNGIALKVPYYLVPRARAKLAASLAGRLSASSASVTATVRNAEGAIPASADFYAWGPSGERDGTGSINVHAAGAQAWDHPLYGRVVVFAINTFERFPTAAINQYDVLVDANLDGKPEYLVSAIDSGLLSDGDFNGQVVVVLTDLATNDVIPEFDAIAPTNGSTLLLPVLAADMGMTATPARFSYAVQSQSFATGKTSATKNVGLFDAYDSAVETGQYAILAPGESIEVPVAINKAEWAKTPPAGLMIVNLDGKAGAQQVQLFKAQPVHPIKAR